MEFTASIDVMTAFMTLKNGNLIIEVRYFVYIQSNVNKFC